jgi:hypothetical protein
LLTANYIFKTVTTVLTVIILASNFVVLSQGYNMYKQRGFFENHKDYSYYRLNYRIDNHLNKTPEEDTPIMNQIFYKRFQNYSLQYIDLTDIVNDIKVCV